MPYFVTTYIVLIIAMIVMGLVMVFMPVPKDARLSVYRHSLYAMAVSYLVLGVYCLIKVHLSLELLSLAFLIASSFQVVFLGTAHMNLVVPEKVNTRFLLQTSVPFLACLVLFLVARLFCGKLTLSDYGILKENLLDLCVLSRLLWVVVLFVEIVFLTYLFFSYQRHYESKVENYIAESSKKAGFYVRHSYLCAVAIGLMAMASSLTVDTVAVGFHNIAMLLLYMLMMYLFMRYLSLFYANIMAVSPDMSEQEDAKTSHCEGTPEQWEAVKKIIEEQKIYLEPGLTVSSLADILKVNKVCLSKTINQREGVNFGTFIGRMRIAEAQRLMREDKSRPLADVAMEVGFSEQSNFSRQFKAITGFTPGEYRNTL